MIIKADQNSQEKDIIIYKGSGSDTVEKIKPLYQRYFGRANIGCDETYFIAEFDNQIIGVVRLSIEDSVPLLRSMLVIPEFRRKGVGKKILREFEKHLIDKNIKGVCCLPWANLETFYTTISFKKYPADSAPIFLQERLHEYQKKESDEIIFMMRE